MFGEESLVELHGWRQDSVRVSLGAGSSWGGLTMWMAGGGIKKDLLSETDEIGYFRN